MDKDVIGTYTTNNSASTQTTRRDLWLAAYQLTPSDSANKNNGMSVRCADSLISTSAAYIRSGKYTGGSPNWQFTEYNSSRAGSSGVNHVHPRIDSAVLQTSYLYGKDGFNGRGEDTIHPIPTLS